MRRGLSLLLIGGIAAVAACSAGEEAADSSADEVRTVERVILGAAKPYTPDRTLDGKIATLDASQKARREVAWKAIAKVLRDRRVADEDAVVDGKRGTVPAFRTWYQRDDIERMFGKLYEGLGKDARKARKAPTNAQIDAVMDWNATDRGSWGDADFEARLKAIDTRAALQGLGGNARVSYSTGMVRHMMKNWAPLTKCGLGFTDNPSAEPAKPDNFAPCLDAEFPKDAAVIKAAWLRSDFGMKVPVRPTDADSLKARFAGTVDEGGWGKGDPANEASPTEDEIYTVKMTDGSSFRMPALHLVTKELREWLWITIWYSPEPNTDFGADRPESITRLGGPWKNYKMCVVTGYEEKDPNPTGGFPTGKGSLGDALAAVYKGVGAPTWCSNQYVERGAHNAQTNCIGCHQHAGTGLRSEAVLGDNTAFPEFGRTKIRKNFPVDYAFAALQPPESVAGLMQQQVEHFELVDR
ncbi:MAG: hypothetical protein JST00_14660 [Deltaproteobacteria bacterium]|nr:hypothetical protein [Deltaproteobacteria bacterium]